MTGKKNVIYLFLICFAYYSNAATYYVSTSGNDTNSGSLTAPFKTFDKAIAVMQAGDECIIRGGTYRQTLTIAKDGTTGNPITFKAMAGEEVFVKATEYVNNWTLYQNNIYKATVNMNLGDYNQVYDTGELMQIARWPNDTDGDRFTIDAKVVTSRGTRASIVTSGLPNVDLDGVMLWYLGGHTGTSWTRPATSVTTTQINFDTLPDSWPFNPHNPSIYRKYGKFGRYYLFNKLSLLDQAKEWYYEPNLNTLYFKTSTGNAPVNNTIEVPHRIQTANITGDYVIIDGIHFFGGKVRILGNNVVFKNNKVIHGLERTDSITNTSAQITEASVEVIGDNTVVESNTIEEGSLSGVFIMSFGKVNNRGKNSRIEKNTIRYFNALGIHASPIRSNSSGVKVLKNLVSHSARDGVYVAGKNCEVAYNDISRSQLINDDSGVFYTVGEKEYKNTEIHHNWIHDAVSPSYSNQKAAGIYLDNDSKGYLVHHNVVWNVTWTGFQLNWENRNNNLYHNTVLDVGDVMGTWVNGRTQTNNNVWNNYTNTQDWLTEPGFDFKDNILDETNVLVEDIAAENFMPKSGSSLIDAAGVIAGFPKDFKGSAPDVGAYEFGGTMWTAGINAVEDTPVNNIFSFRVSSTATSISLDDLSNPTLVNSDDNFQVEISGLDPAKTYNLFNQLNNKNTSVQVAGFPSTGITGVESIIVDVNWNAFPNNPLVTSISDEFEWKSKLFVPGEGLVMEIIIPDILYDITLSTPDILIKKKSLSVFPNPTRGVINVSGINESSASFLILDVNGKEIRESKNFEGLEKGIYFLQITNSQINVLKRVIVN